MKAQFSPIPREIDKFICSLEKDKVGNGTQFDALIEHLIKTIRPKLRTAVHFELPPRKLTDFGGHYTAEDILAACEPELKLPYPVVSLYREVDEQPVFIVAWDKTMWIEKKEDLGNIIYIYALTKMVDEGVWYPSHAELRLEPDEVLVPERLKDSCFAMWHSYGWVNSKAPRDANGKFKEKWIEEITRDIVELCALLRMPTCRIETQKESRLRAKIGTSKKKPKTFYDVHRVIINNKARTKIPSEPKGGTHASPRWHKRRGYWRTMKKSGKQVWVQPCEVGKKSDGMVYKDYEVVTTGE